MTLCLRVIVVTGAELLYGNFVKHCCGKEVVNTANIPIPFPRVLLLPSRCYLAQKGAAGQQARCRFVTQNSPCTANGAKASPARGDPRRAETTKDAVLVRVICARSVGHEQLSVAEWNKLVDASVGGVREQGAGTAGEARVLYAELVRSWNASGAMGRGRLTGENAKTVESQKKVRLAETTNCFSVGDEPSDKRNRRQARHHRIIILKNVLRNDDERWW